MYVSQVEVTHKAAGARYLGDFAKAGRGIQPINRDRAVVKASAVRLRKKLREFLASRVPGIATQISALMPSAEKSSQGGQSKHGALRDDILQALEFDDWAVLPEQVLGLLSTVASDGGVQALKQIGLPGDDELERRVRDRAEVWAKDRAAQMVGMKWDGYDLIPNPNAKWQITESTRDGLRGFVEQALDEGWSTDELAAKLADSYPFSPERASMIARTETASADVAGAMQGYRESGVVTMKFWLTAEDDKVSDECMDCAKAGKIGLDEDFPTGVDGPPNHPNCRCSVLPVLDDETPALLEEKAEKAFNPDQPRDGRGRWGDGSGLSAGALADLTAGKGASSVAVAQMNSATQRLLGTSTAEVRLSHDTAVKQATKHPDVKASDYARVQPMLAHAEIRQDRDRHFLLLEQSKKDWVAVVKAKKTGKGVWLQSLRRSEPEKTDRLRQRSTLVREKT